jgi:hypothetical protein
MKVPNPQPKKLQKVAGPEKRKKVQECEAKLQNFGIDFTFLVIFDVVKPLRTRISAPKTHPTRVLSPRGPGPTA